MNSPVQKVVSRRAISSRLVDNWRPMPSPSHATATPPVQVCHLILRLDTGGAEQSLYRLIRGTADRLSHAVICFGGETAISRDIAALGVAVHCLNYRRTGPLALLRARHLLRELSPGVVQGWMYWGNVLASWLRPIGSRLCWNVRSSIDAPEQESLTVRRSLRASTACQARPRQRPDTIIFNSHAGQASHARFGFDAVPGMVIPNGLDLDEFAPDQQARDRVRGEYDVGDATWIGMVGRYHPVKGVQQFVSAAARLARQHANVRFVLVGTGMDANNQELAGIVTASGLPPERLDLAGEIRPINGFLPGLDLLVVASLREGSPNALLEAMACEVNCVATDVGDVRRVLDDEARIAAPGDVADLAAKMGQCAGAGCRGARGAGPGRPGSNRAVVCCRCMYGRVRAML